MTSADINARDSHGRTQLYHAVYSGNKKEVEDLLAAGAQLGSAQSNNDNELFVASEKGFADIVSVLLRHGADLGSTNVHGITALQRAATSGHTDVVKILLDAGDDVNGKWHDRTPLMSAIFHDAAEETVALLLSRNAQTSHQDEHGYTALCYALDNSMYARRDSTAADHARRASIVRRLLQSGANPNQTWGENRTPLMYAIFHNARAEAVSELLRGGADVNHRDAHGKTALAYAADKGRTDLVELLIENDADAYIKDENGKTAEDCARAKGDSITGDFIKAAATTFREKDFNERLDKIKTHKPQPIKFKKPPTP